jgi:hypothetical protein
MLYYFKLPLFGPFICISCLSFLSPEEWSWIKARAQAIIGTNAASAPARPAKQSVVIAGNQTNIKK